MEPVNLNEETKKVSEEVAPKKARPAHAVRRIEKKLLEKGVRRMERHSDDGISRGRGPAKSGHGGRFTWEGPHSELDPELGALDKGDPMYEEEEEENEMVVGEWEVAKVAENREGVSRIEIRATDKA